MATVPRTGLPDEFKRHGLRNLPAIIHGDEALDAVEEIVDYIEAEFPEPALAQDTAEAERVTRNFFSRWVEQTKRLVWVPHCVCILRAPC